MPSIDLPKTLPESHQLIASLFHQIEDLKLKIKKLNAAKYGQSSEKEKYLDLSLDQYQGSLFEDLKDQLARLEKIKEEAEKSSEETALKTQKDENKKPRKKRGEFAKDLPVEEVHHGQNLQECPQCESKQLKEIGQEVSERIEFIPAKIFIEKHITHKFICRNCEKFTRGVKPIPPIEKCIAGPKLLTHVIYSKFFLHLPFYRLHRDLLELGIDISEANMCNWMNNLANDVFKPLYFNMKNELLKARYLYCDETTVRQQAKRKCITKYLWGYTCLDPGPYVLYDYSNRTRENPSNFLKDFKNGYLITDKYAGYQQICNMNNLTRAFCWAHARRKFVECLSNDKKYAALIIKRIDVFLKLDKSFRKEHSGDDLLKLRGENIVPLLDDFFEMLLTIKEDPMVLPSRDISTAINYVLKSKEEFCVFAKSSDFEPTNNTAERNLRPITIGRKNWLFIGSERSGKSAAIVYSIIASAKLNGINIRKYLEYVIEFLPRAKSSELGNFLPDKYKLTQGV